MQADGTQPFQLTALLPLGLRYSLFSTKIDGCLDSIVLRNSIYRQAASLPITEPALPMTA